MVVAKFFTTKQHCHCPASNLIPNDDELKRNVELSSDMLHVGKTLLYTNAGQNSYVGLRRSASTRKLFYNFELELQMMK